MSLSFGLTPSAAVPTAVDSNPPRRVTRGSAAADVAATGSMIPPTQTPNSASAQQQPMPSASLRMSQSQSQPRPSAASRRKLAQAQSSTATPAAAATSTSQQAASASAIALGSPSRGTQLPSASHDAPMTASVMPVRSHLAGSSGDLASATAASRSSAAVSAAVASTHEPHSIDDSHSSLAPFTLDTLSSGDECATPFLLFTNHQPATDVLNLFLLQKGPPSNVPSSTPGALSASARLYRFSGPLLSLRPYGLYMSGLKDVEYRHYVLNGLAQQDEAQNSFEYELITQPDEDDNAVGPEGEPLTKAQRALSRRKSSLGGASVAATAPAPGGLVKAQLKLYKRMGERITRVPVCIAHIRFEAMKLSTLASATGDTGGAMPPRQDEAEYAISFSALMSALSGWTKRLRAKRRALDRTLAAQGEEQKIAEELTGFPPLAATATFADENITSMSRSGSSHVSGGVGQSELVALRRDLLRQAAGLLNGKKAEIRSLRADIDAMRTTRDAMLSYLKGSRGRKAGEEDDEETSSSQGSQSESDTDAHENRRNAILDFKKSETVPNATEFPKIDEDAAFSVQEERLKARTPSPSPPPPFAERGVSLGGMDTYDSFPASVDPASLPSFSASLLPSVTQSQQPLSAPGSGRGPAAAPASPYKYRRAPPSAPPSGGLVDVSLPKAQLQVRKRARVNPPPQSMSQRTPSWPTPSPPGSGGQNAAAAPVHRPSNPRALGLDREKSSSQLQRDIGAGGNGASLAALGRKNAQTSFRASNEQAAVAAAHPVSNKRQRTQPSERTSRLLSDME